jgi:Zn-dependent protease with chaperone function
VRSARRIFGLQLAIGAVGVAVIAGALFVVLRTLTFESPSPEELAAACRSFTVPNLTPPSLALFVLGSVSFAAIAMGARSLIRQVSARRRFMARLHVLTAIPMNGREMFVIDDGRPQAFCTGLLRSRVYISHGALELLDDDELAAVHAHEAHHARRRDPLRVLLVRTLSEAIFFLPALRRLAGRYEALAELSADEAAVERAGDPRPLAGALLAFERNSTPAVVGIAPERVDNLLGQTPRWELPAAMLAGAAVTLAAALAVVVRVADATQHAHFNLPLLAAQACMLLMAVVPLVLGAAALLGSRRLILLRRGA